MKYIVLFFLNLLFLIALLNISFGLQGVLQECINGGEIFIEGKKIKCVWLNSDEFAIDLRKK